MPISMSVSMKDHMKSAIVLEFVYEARLACKYDSDIPQGIINDYSKWHAYLGFERLINYNQLMIFKEFLSFLHIENPICTGV